MYKENEYFDVFENLHHITTFYTLQLSPYLAVLNSDQLPS